MGWFFSYQGAEGMYGFPYLPANRFERNLFSLEPEYLIVRSLKTSELSAYSILQASDSFKAQLPATFFIQWPK